MKLIKKLLVVLAIVFCSGCVSDSATSIPFPTPQATMTTEVFELLQFNEALSFSGDTFFTSTPFKLNDPGRIEIAWGNSGKDPLAIWILNNNEFSGDPQYDRVLVKNIDTLDATGKSSLDLIAGAYVVEVEVAGGPWQITITLIP